MACMHTFQKRDATTGPTIFWLPVVPTEINKRNSAEADSINKQVQENDYSFHYSGAYVHVGKYHIFGPV